MDDLLVRGGLVVDGTGAAARAADVRVRDGRIAEIGPALRPDGERVLDASGAYVTPGFIDIHTHFDPTVFWDPLCDPMPQHGVTTVLVGNCSLSLAPVRPGHRKSLQELLCYIEDLPAEVLDVSIPWGWESYGEYLSAADKLGGFAVNMAGMVGHNMLRTYVMGESAWDRPATDQERARIAALLDDSLAAGRGRHVDLARLRRGPGQAAGAEPPGRRRRTRRAARRAGQAPQVRSVHPGRHRPPDAPGRAADGRSDRAARGGEHLDRRVPRLRITRTGRGACSTSPGSSRPRGCGTTRRSARAPWTST